jgi:hypothetical protein
MLIRRGTNPTIPITIPEEAFDTADIRALNVTFAQHRRPVIEKGLEDCLIDGQQILVPLTLKETLSLREGAEVEVQLRAIIEDGTTEGSYQASQIVEYAVGRILKEGEL